MTTVRKKTRRIQSITPHISYIICKYNSNSNKLHIFNIEWDVWINKFCSFIESFYLFFFRKWASNNGPLTNITIIILLREHTFIVNWCRHATSCQPRHHTVPSMQEKHMPPSCDTALAKNGLSHKLLATFILLILWWYFDEWWLNFHATFSVCAYSLIYGARLGCRATPFTLRQILFPFRWNY